MKFTIGAIGDAAVEMDLAVLVETRLLVQAQSGGGKTTTLRRILEQTHGHIQQLVIDPEGEFFTLRERYDYIIAGKGGDCAADPRSAKLLARRLLELGVSAILDLSELPRLDQVAFVRHFCEALVAAPKALRHPVLVAIDEAHIFAPEQGKAESMKAVIDLITLGRKRGLAPILATQRLSKLHKDAAAELRNVLIGQTGLDIDQIRAGNALGFGKDARLALRDLDWAQFFAYGPAFSHRGVELLRIGETATKNPKTGADLAPPAAPSERLRKLLAKVADVPAEAEAEALDMAALQRQNADLRRQLSAANKAPTPAPTAPCGHERALAALEREKALAYERVAYMGEQIADRDRVRDEAVAILRRRSGPEAPRRKWPDMPVEAPPLSPEAQARERRPKAESWTAAEMPQPPGAIAGPEQRVLDALAWCEAIGLDAPAQQAVCFLAGYAWGGGFFKPRGTLKSKGLVTYPGDGRIALTEEGRALAQAPMIAPTLSALHNAVLGRLDGPERRVLEPLLPVYPEAMMQEALAEAAGYSWGGGYFKPRGRLKTWGLVEYVDGGVRAAPLLFPEELT